MDNLFVVILKTMFPLVPSRNEILKGPTSLQPSREIKIFLLFKCKGEYAFLYLSFSANNL